MLVLLHGHLLKPAEPAFSSLLKQKQVHSLGKPSLAVSAEHIEEEEEGGGRGGGEEGIDLTKGRSRRHGDTS